MGLRFRLILIVILGSGISLLVSLGVMVRMEASLEARRSAERAGALLRTLAVPVALYVTQGRVADIDNLNTELARHKSALDLSRFILVDHEGIVIADSENELYGQVLSENDAFIARAMKSPSPLVERAKSGDPHRVAVPVETGIRWGTLIGTLDEDALSARVQERSQRLIAIGVVTGLIGLLVLLVVLSVFVVAPLRSVGQAAQRFANGDLSARVPVRGGDEIAYVAKALNAAGERLQNHTAELKAEVQKRTEALQDANAKLRQLAITDPLTGLKNRRFFMDTLNHEVNRQQRARHPFSLLMLDIDHFKDFNDTHGHQAGDALLVGFAQCLEENVRETDTVARYGGEEFVVVLIGTNPGAAELIAEKLCTSVAEKRFLSVDGEPFEQVTVSVGVASWPDNALTASSLILASDQALYQSKDEGRNRVTLAWENIDKVASVPPVVARAFAPTTRPKDGTPIDDESSET